MPAHPDLRALEVVYRYRLEDVNETSRLPRRALEVALRAEGETIGSIAAISRSTDSPFSAEVQEALENVARRAGPAVWNALRYMEARELAELDPLTSLHNRRLFYEFLAREIARARRYERSLSLIVFDVDDFKRINDRIGHPAGDAVLIAIADCVRSVVRETDIACRYGGDEFCVIVPESSRDDAELLADRIALAIRQQKVEKVGALKISAGVAELRPNDAAPDLFKRADDALLRAKGDGKGRIVAN
jgi:diguanylate cyclase (GGDEF)-like protein